MMSFDTYILVICELALMYQKIVPVQSYLYSSILQGRFIVGLFIIIL